MSFPPPYGKIQKKEGVNIKILLIFALVVVVKFALNLSKFLFACRLRDKYQKSFTQNGKAFEEYIPQAKKLFVDADLGKNTISVVEPLGFRQIATHQINVIENLGNRRRDIVATAMGLFDELVGTYRMRMLESLSPRYWIEAIIFLPRHLIRYLGGKPNGLFTKIFQIIYWLATPLLLAFRTEIYNFVVALIEKV